MAKWYIRQGDAFGLVMSAAKRCIFGGLKDELMCLSALVWRSAAYSEIYSVVIVLDWNFFYALILTLTLSSCKRASEIEFNSMEVILIVFFEQNYFI